MTRRRFSRALVATGTSLLWSPCGLRAEESPSLAPSIPEDPAMTALATKLVAQGQSGKPDRTLFTPKMNGALTPVLVSGIARILEPLGKPKSIAYLDTTASGMYRTYRYGIAWDSGTVVETFTLDATGKIARWIFKPDFIDPPEPGMYDTPKPAASPAPTPSL